MDKKISYLNRTYADYKEALIEMSERYYPGLSTSLRDSSIGAWQIDLAADIADNLSYHIDRVYQETNIESAQERASLYSIARNNGIKIPGPKGAMAEVCISITVNNDDYNNKQCPIIKRGSRFASATQEFELLYDVDFNSQFDEDSDSDMTVVPHKTSNGINTGYTISKLAVVVAGESKVFRQTIKASDIKPFMEILIPATNVMNIESILVVDGADAISVPSYNTFYGEGCSNSGITRFYEVDNLAQNKIWDEKIGENGAPEKYEYTTSSGSVMCIKRGEWKPITHKFITEYTNNGYLKVIFGAGNGEYNAEIGNGAFKTWQMSRIMNNNNLGILPTPNSTLFILYRVGGGAASNVAKGAINKKTYLNAIFKNPDTADDILKTLRVENTIPSMSGKDMPSVQELKYYIKYNRAAQERCVTVKDYVDRILQLPPKFGTPFRVGVAEENNKIVIYILGIDNEGKLSDKLPTTLIENIEDYLSEYRMINDFVEIKAGRIINVSFDIEVIIDKNYNKNDVSSLILNKVKDYMDINRHIMGEEIYVGDLEREISNIDGVLNLISIKIKNEREGEGDRRYSYDEPSQVMITESDNSSVFDLEASDWILYNDGDSMMEIKYPDIDIRLQMKQR